MVPLIYIFAFFLTFISGLVCYPFFITLTKRLLAIQPISEYLPKHENKRFTPTLGGVVISLSAILFIGIFSGYAEDIALPVVCSIFFYAYIGFIDDFTKVRLKNNKGIRPRTKLFLQVLAGAICMLLIKLSNSVEGLTTLFFPFGYSFDLGWLYYIFGIFLLVGVSNSVNLTDGLDGLAISTVFSAIAALLVVALVGHNYQVVLVISCVAGAAAAFAPFNLKPAKIFMGDVGSLSLGAFIALISILLKVEIFMIFFAFIPLVEALSVIIQLSVLRLSNRKIRVFLMAPIHHHFERLDFTETQIVRSFWLISVLMAVLGLLLWST